MTLLVLFTSGFFIQMFYHWFYFRRLAFYRDKKESTDEAPVSVIVCARNEYENLRKNLPLLLDQDYPLYELIIVNDSSDDDTTDLLNDFRKRYGNLKVFDLQQNLNFFKGKKFPLALGIKSASHEIILLTDADCRPASNQWVKKMQSKFTPGTEIVLGYGAYEKQPGMVNRFIRFDTLHVAIQYLSYALAGKTYMGVGRNLSYRKSLFFSQKGFSAHYKLHSGDDDLFINGVATKTNTRIEISKQSHTVSSVKSSFGEWFTQKRRHLTTAGYYRKGSKRRLVWYGLSKTMIYFSAVALILINYNLVIVLPALLAYFISLGIIFRMSSAKLDEKDLAAAAPLMDLLMSILNPVLYLSIYLAKPDKWK